MWGLVNAKMAISKTMKSLRDERDEEVVRAMTNGKIQPNTAKAGQ